MHESGDVSQIETLQPKRWWTLVVLCLSLSIVMIANGSLNVALPMLARDLGASTSQLQWIVDAYALVFAGMLFTAGALGDRFGRKGALQGGLLLFLVAAGAAALSDSAAQVIAARAVMGLAAALVMPSTLSILTNVFPAHERGRAIALWAGIAAGGAALGPPTSGFLLEHFWWGSVFLVNVPLIVLALVLGRRLVPTSRDPQHHPFDVPGAALSVVGIGALVYAIIEAPHHGWVSANTGLALGLAAAALAAFVVRERTTAEPMLDLRLFRDARFSVASLGIALAFFTMFGTFFLLTQYLQLVLGYSPFKAGLLVLPMSLTLMLVAPQAPKFVARYGVTRAVPAGLAIVAAGLVMFSTLREGGAIWSVYAAVVPMAAGMGLAMSPLTALIMSSVPAGRAGVGSAMNDTTRELGGALGVAVLGSIVNTRFGNSIGTALDGVPSGAREEAASGLSGALQTAARLPADTGARLVAVARESFVDGLQIAALAAAVVVAGTAVLARFLLPRTPSAVPERHASAVVVVAPAVAD